MKSNIFCTMVFILIGNIVIAQEDQNNPKVNSSQYWDLTFSMGMTETITSKKLTDASKPGLSYNLDVSLISTGRIGFFINYASGSFSGRPYDYQNSYTSLKKTIEYSQFTVGPRFYSSSKNSFIDGGIGYFVINNDKALGVSLGVGGKIEISDIYSLSLGGRYNAADLFDEPYSNFTVYAGLGINNKVVKPNANNVKNRISIAALTGSYGDRTSSLENNSFGTEISYGTGKKTAILLHYLFVKAEQGYYNYLGEYIRYSDMRQTEITGGVRLYITGNNIKLFMESLTGAYLITNESGKDPRYFIPYSASNSYFGITFGAGVEFSLIDNLSGLIKTDFSNYIKEGSYIGLFGGLKYGI